ncbi:hypothetical protein D3C75_1255290 [compost metagenome]
MHQALAQPLALPVFADRHCTFAPLTARYARIAADADLLQLTVYMNQGDIGHALVVVHGHVLRVQARQAAAESGNEAKAP